MTTLWNDQIENAARRRGCEALVTIRIILQAIIVGMLRPRPEATMRNTIWDMMNCGSMVSTKTRKKIVKTVFKVSVNVVQNFSHLFKNIGSIFCHWGVVLHLQLWRWCCWCSCWFLCCCWSSSIVGAEGALWASFLGPVLFVSPCCVWFICSIDLPASCRILSSTSLNDGSFVLFVWLASPWSLASKSPEMSGYIPCQCWCWLELLLFLCGLLLHIFSVENSFRYDWR